jgi:hypothetical protein
MSCEGCQQKATVPVGRDIPQGWIIVYNPLFENKYWQVTACSHRCATKKRIEDILGRCALGGPKASLEN